jgi:hypothetical protein
VNAKHILLPSLRQVIVTAGLGDKYRVNTENAVVLAETRPHYRVQMGGEGWDCIGGKDKKSDSISR